MSGSARRKCCRHRTWTGRGLRRRSSPARRQGSACSSITGCATAVRPLADMHCSTRCSLCCFSVSLGCADSDPSDDHSFFAHRRSGWCRAGLSNKSSIPRPMIYITYSKPSFRDTENFSSERYETLPPLVPKSRPRQVIPPIGAEGLDRRPPAGACRLFLGPGFRLGAR